MKLKEVFSRDFRFTFINQIWRLIYGPLLILMIPLFLSEKEQGYWFTISSLAMLAMLADLGFTAIVLQFSAHEFAHLKFDTDGYIIGDKNSLFRLSSLFRFSLKWTLGVIIFIFPILLVIGYNVLSQQKTDIEWFYPWLLFNIASIFVFFTNVVLSFIEGCDSVGDINKIRVISRIILTVSTIVLLFLHFKIYALAISMCISVLSSLILLYNKYKNMLVSLLQVSKEATYKWSSKILPLLGKYSLSWISGYLIFNTFTPIAFHFYGAEIAGKIGLSIALWTAIYGLSNVWITSIMPKINMFISKKNYVELNKIFFKYMVFALITFLVGAFFVFLTYKIIQDTTYANIINRFLPPFSLFFLAFAWMCQVIVNALAVYIRSHKEEPLVTMSIANAIYVLVATFIIANSLKFEYYFLGLASSYFLVLPWIVSIFKTYYNKKEMYCNQY